MDHANARAKFEVRSYSLPVPEIISIGVLGGFANANLESWVRGGPPLTQEEAVGHRG